MSIRKKGRRKIRVNNELFVWWVEENDDGPGYVLHVCSDNRTFITMFPLDSAEIQPYIVVLGERFEGAETGRVWRRFNCPNFSEDNIVKPGNVRALIDWCLSSEVERTSYRTEGYPIL